ncbi:MAG: ABC transporter ATP-binding protein, partial [Cypionkella sp.]
GQQQRVALARAIVNEPKILLLDEPMAALDKKLRRDMQIELQTLQRQLGITFVLVTHDQEEALSMSDRICVMQGGKIVQIGSPRALYDSPNTRYVADFVGKTNFFEGVVTAIGDSCQIHVAGLNLSAAAPRALAVGQTASLCLRPEQITLHRNQTLNDRISVPVTIAARIFLGEHTEYLVNNVELGKFLVLVPRQAEAVEGAFESGQMALASWRDGVGLILGND